MCTYPEVRPTHSMQLPSLNAWSWWFSSITLDETHIVHPYATYIHLSLYIYILTFISWVPGNMVVARYSGWRCMVVGSSIETLTWLATQSMLGVLLLAQFPSLDPFYAAPSFALWWPNSPIQYDFSLIFSFSELIVGFIRIKLSLLFGAPTTYISNVLVVMLGRE